MEISCLQISVSSLSFLAIIVLENISPETLYICNLHSMVLLQEQFVQVQFVLQPLTHFHEIDCDICSGHIGAVDVTGTTFD